MSDPEFEAYLGLLSRFLQLDGRQREDIRRELRAHLEEAVEEALAAGATRAEAIQRALEEFGDAAELAARFSTVGRKRRWIMRGSLAAACMGLGVLVFNTLSPNATPTAVARLGPAGDVQAPRLVSFQPVPDEADARDRQIEAALARDVQDVKFSNTTLEDAVTWFRDLLQVNVHVRWKDLEDHGVARDAAVSLTLKGVTAERALRLALEDASSDVELGYEIDDGVLIIASTDRLSRRLAARVYDVRDLLAMGAAHEEATPHPAPEAPAAASEDADDDDDDEQPSAPHAAPVGIEQPGDKDDAETGDAQDEAADDLMEVISNSIAPDTWTDHGGTGSQLCYNGVLVVRQSAGVHRQIQRLLSDLRHAGAARPD